AEVLRVIATSPTVLPRVFETLANRAFQLCDASGTTVWQVEGDVLRCEASVGPAFEHRVVGETFRISPGTMLGRSVLEGRIVHVEDHYSPQSLADFPETRRGTNRTTLAVPLLRDGVAIGAIGAARQEVRPFSDAQIRLLETFADQAVIAIAN